MKGVPFADDTTASSRLLLENGKTIATFDDLARLQRYDLYAAGVDQLLSVEDLDYSGTAETPAAAETVWPMVDRQGSLIGLHRASSTAATSGAANEFLTYNPFGLPSDAAGHGTAEDQLIDVVSQRYLGWEFDWDAQLYRVGGQFYEPIAGRLLSPNAAAAPGANPYTLDGNSPDNMRSVANDYSGQYIGTYYDYAAAFDSWYGEGSYDKSFTRAFGVLQAVGGAVEVAGGVAIATATGAPTMGVGVVVGGVVVVHGLDNIQAGLRQAYWGTEIKTGTYELAKAATGSDTAATAIDLGVGLLIPGVEDAGLIMAKGAPKAAAFMHAGKRVGIAAGFAGTGFAIGASGENGSWERGLQYAAVGATVGQLTARYMVACFTAGTPIVVDFDGTAKLVEDIREGDLLLARDERDPDGPLVLKRVEEVFVRVAPVIELVVRGRIIGTTAEHPFYVVERQDFVAAGEIEVGETFVSHDGQRVTLEAIRDTGTVANVYNFRVADFHTYFVGGKNWGFTVWVHNANYGLRGTQIAETAWAAKTGQGYDRWFRRFWRELEGQTIGDGIEVAYVNRRLAKGIQPDLVLVDHRSKLVRVHDLTSRPNVNHLAKGENYVDYFRNKFQGYEIEYTESYWRGSENTVQALSSSGVKYYPGATKP